MNFTCFGNSEPSGSDTRMGRIDMQSMKIYADLCSMQRRKNFWK